MEQDPDQVNIDLRTSVAPLPHKKRRPKSPSRFSKTKGGEELEVPNPCSLVCANLSTAALVLASLNMTYSIMKLMWYAIVHVNYDIWGKSDPGEEFDIGRSTGQSDFIIELQQPFIFACLCAANGYEHGSKGFIPIMDKGLLSCWVADVLLSIAFVGAVMVRKTRCQIWICSLFMWYHFLYPGALIYLVLLVSTLVGFGCPLGTYFWLAAFLGLPIFVVWVKYNGLVAKAVRYRLRQGITLMEHHEELEEIPISTERRRSSGQRRSS